jgi:hypothetical protein
MEMAEAAYRQMVLAANGFREYASIVRGELWKASERLEQYRGIARPGILGHDRV